MSDKLQENTLGIVREIRNLNPDITEEELQCQLLETVKADPKLVNDIISYVLSRYV
jgi:hypothetical protein